MTDLHFVFHELAGHAFVGLALGVFDRATVGFDFVDVNWDDDPPQHLFAFACAGGIAELVLDLGETAFTHLVRGQLVQAQDLVFARMSPEDRGIAGHAASLCAPDFRQACLDAIPVISLVSRSPILTNHLTVMMADRRAVLTYTDHHLKMLVPYLEDAPCLCA